MKTLTLSLLATATLGITGCTAVADFAGADSATLNAQAAQGYTQMVQSARSKGQLDTSSATYQRINALYVRMRPYADQMNTTGQRFNWELAVFKSNELNAYVFPGGKVVFYSGIVDRLNLTDAEIAAVMGHEMTHALEEHTKSKLGAQALTNFAIGIGKSYAGDSIGTLGSAAIDLGSQVGVGLPYSRNLETRADTGGLMLMARAGYNPQAAISFWEKMNRASGAGGASFLSTHPSGTQRIIELRQQMPQALAIYNQRR